MAFMGGAGAAAFLDAFIAFMACLVVGMMKDVGKETCDAFDIPRVC